MSLGQDLSAVYDDDFEGSGNEILISQKVFYGIDSAAGGERRELNGFINFGCQQHKFVGSSPSLNTGVAASVASSKDSCLKDGNNVHGGSPRTSASSSFTEGFVLSESNDHAVPAKRMKVAINELSSFKPLLEKAVTSEVPLKAIASGVHSPNSCLDSQIVTCHVVESSGEGVRSSCYLLKQGVETERKGCLGDRVPSKDYSLISEGSEGKEIVVCNAMASPVSQESCLVGASVGETGSRQRALRKRKIGTPIVLDDYDITWTSDCTKDVRPIVRSHMFHLLVSAGWVIESRRRQCRNYDEFVFISPLLKPVRELSKAWNLCGQKLLAHKYKQMQVEDGRQWANLEEFSSDLYSILTNMGNELKHWEPKAALAQKWVLLDPFVSVIFVDRKILALKAGNVVKAKRSATGKSMVLYKGKRTDDDRPKAKLCDPSLVTGSTVIDFGRQSQGSQLEASMRRSIYVSEGDCMRLLETDNKNGGYSAEVCINDYMQPDTYPYDVPVENGIVCVIDAASNKVSTHQDDASDAVMHESSQLCGTDVKYRQCFDSSSLRNSRADGCLASSSKGKLPKKSKKMSDIEPTSLSEVEILNMSTPFRVQNTNKSNRKSSKKMSSSVELRRKNATKVKSYSCQLKDDDLLISAMIQKKRFRSRRTKSMKAGAKLRHKNKRKSKKSGCRLLPRNLGKGGRSSLDGRWFSVAQRTVLSWLINTGFIFVNDIIQCRDLKEEIVVKDGIITRNGIRCKCCNMVLSLSEFKAHTGLEMDCLSLSLVKGSGQPFTLRLLEAWSAEYKARKAGVLAIQSEVSDQNDDSCGICGDGGELLCCDNCPSTFHQSCLSAEELPDGSWYCTSCTCWICGNLVDDEATSAYCGFKCWQCEHKYHIACLKEVDMDRMSSNPGFCSGSCEEVYSGLQSRVGLCNHIAGGYSWSVLRCIHDNQKVHSAQGVALMAECNSKLAVALTIMEECFVSMVDSRTGIDMISHVVYNWGSEFPRLNYDGFYNFVLEKNDVVICVASVRVHGAKVAEMPLVATCSKYRRKGMCRRLITAIEQMLIYLKVENLVVAAIPELVPTWTVGFGFVPVEEEEKKNLHKVNLMVFPGTVLLKKTLYSDQTADLQGAGSVAGVSSMGMDRSIEEEASLGEKCKIKYGNYECTGGSDTGCLNADFFSSYDLEVVEGQMISSCSQGIGSRDTDNAVYRSCTSLGQTECGDAHKVLPHSEANETAQDMNMLAVYHNMITGVCVDSRVDTFTCPETWQVGAVVSDGTEIKMPNFTVSKIGADQNVSEVESENSLWHEIYSEEKVELPGTCVYSQVDEMGTIKEADFETENAETASQEMHTDEKTETQLISDTKNKLSLMDELRKLVSWSTHSNASR